MTFENEFRFSPMLGSTLSFNDGEASFAPLRESAIMTGTASRRGVDWVGVGQMMRHELGRTDHAAFPPQITNSTDCSSSHRAKGYSFGGAAAGTAKNLARGGLVDR
jgi:hypothetical protein